MAPGMPGAVSIPAFPAVGAIEAAPPEDGAAVSSSLPETTTTSDSSSCPPPSSSSSSLAAAATAVVVGVDGGGPSPDGDDDDDFGAFDAEDGAAVSSSLPETTTTSDSSSCPPPPSSSSLAAAATAAATAVVVGVDGDGPSLTVLPVATASEQFSTALGMWAQALGIVLPLNIPAAPAKLSPLPAWCPREQAVASRAEPPDAVPSTCIPPPPVVVAHTVALDCSDLALKIRSAMASGSAPEPKAAAAPPSSDPWDGIPAVQVALDVATALPDFTSLLRPVLSLSTV
jgi:hypothetical protein